MLFEIFACCLASLAAFGATGGLVGETFFRIKRLFAFGERKFFTAVFASQVFICHPFAKPPVRFENSEATSG